MSIGSAKHYTSHVFKKDSWQFKLFSLLCVVVFDLKADKNPNYSNSLPPNRHRREMTELHKRHNDEYAQLLLRVNSLQEENNTDTSTTATTQQQATFTSTATTISTVAEPSSTTNTSPLGGGSGDDRNGVPSHHNRFDIVLFIYYLLQGAVAQWYSQRTSVVVVAGAIPASVKVQESYPQ